MKHYSEAVAQKTSPSLSINRYL